MGRKGKYGIPAYIFCLIHSIVPLEMKRRFWKVLYQYLVTRMKNMDLLLWNFGFAGLNPNEKTLSLENSDEKYRYCIQLYHHIASAVNLRGKDVLDVSCGCGGGSCFVMKYHKPKSMIGIDLSEKAIDFCNSYYSIEGLSFSCGDAESLPFEENTFDIVINVEASHCYGLMGRFLDEVCRVLRSNGYFLFTDFRRKTQISCLRKQLSDSGLTLIKEEFITPHVLKAMELDHDRKVELIHQKTPKILHNTYKYWWGTRLSKRYELFKTRDEEYFHYVLQKQNS
jgi:ubiquinone/menaquinone biosynthesis C-methylase UbiE